MAEIEYFYSAHSAFAYLGSARFMAIARAAGRRIAHRPMDLRRVVPESGSLPFGKRSKAHVAYFFGREIERWSELRGAPTMAGIPTTHANDPGLANRMLIAGLGRGIDIDGLAHAMLEAHWRNDANLADPATLAGIGRAVGVDVDALLDEAATPKVQQVYQANTEEAIRRAVFGSPTYVVDGDMFYGQDRLELVERALQQPFAARWSKRGAA
jgi:2-hydroxychromene-2-carboxylate isomerase